MHHIAQSPKKPILSNSNLEIFEAYLLSKAHRLPFYHSHIIYAKLFAIVHIDLWGPVPVNSMNGMKYFFFFFYL